MCPKVKYTEIEREWILVIRIIQKGEDTSDRKCGFRLSKLVSGITRSTAHWRICEINQHGA